MTVILPFDGISTVSITGRASRGEGIGAQAADGRLLNPLPVSPRVFL